MVVHAESQEEAYGHLAALEASVDLQPGCSLSFNNIVNQTDVVARLLGGSMTYRSETLLGWVETLSNGLEDGTSFETDQMEAKDIDRDVVDALLQLIKLGAKVRKIGSMPSCRQSLTTQCNPLASRYRPYSPYVRSCYGEASFLRQE